MARASSVSTLWVALAVALGGFSAWQVYSDSERAECQTKYNLAFADQLRIRSELATTSDQAQSALLLGVARMVAQPPATTDKEAAARAREFKGLFTSFEKSVAASEKARRDTPLPPIPDCART